MQIETREEKAQSPFQMWLRFRAYDRQRLLGFILDPIRVILDRSRVI